LISQWGFLFAFISTISLGFNESTAYYAASSAGKAAYKSKLAASFSLLMWSACTKHSALVLSHSSFLIFASILYFVTVSNIILVSSEAIFNFSDSIFNSASIFPIVIFASLILPVPFL